MQRSQTFFQQPTTKKSDSPVLSMNLKKALMKITSYLKLIDERIMVSSHFFSNPVHFRARLNTLLAENSDFKKIFLTFAMTAAFNRNVTLPPNEDENPLQLDEQELAAILAFARSEKLVPEFKIYYILNQNLKDINAYENFKNKILAHPSYKKLRLNIWFDDLNKAIYLGHSAQHLSIVLDRLFPDTRYNKWNQGGDLFGLTVKSTYDLDYKLLREQTKPIEQKASWKDVELPPSLSLPELVDQIITPQGLTIGEGHETKSSKKFVMESVEQLKKNVRVVFLEHLIVEDHQSLLDEYFITKKMPKELKAYLKHLDQDNYLYKGETPYTFTNMVKTLVEADIRVIAFDNRISYSIQDNDQLRMQTMNSLAAGALNQAREQGYIKETDSFIFFVGSMHMYTFENAPGVCDYTKTLGILISPLIKGLVDQDCIKLNVKNLFDSGIDSEIVLFLNEKENSLPEKIPTEKKEISPEIKEAKEFRP